MEVGSALRPEDLRAVHVGGARVVALDVRVEKVASHFSPAAVTISCMDGGAPKKSVRKSAIANFFWCSAAHNMPLHD